MTKKYKDAPRYPVINQYEGEFKKSWKDVMKIALTEFKVGLTKALKE